MELKDKQYLISVNEYDEPEYDSIVFYEDDTRNCILNFVFPHEVPKVKLYIHKPNKRWGDFLEFELLTTDHINFKIELETTLIDEVGTYLCRLVGFDFEETSRRTYGDFKYKILDTIDI